MKENTEATSSNMSSSTPTRALPEDRKSYLDNQCIRAMRGMGSMPEGVESVRIVKRA